MKHPARKAAEQERERLLFNVAIGKRNADHGRVSDDFSLRDRWATCQSNVLEPVAGDGYWWRFGVAADAKGG